VDALLHIAPVLTAIAGGVWVLRGKLGDIERSFTAALTAHVASDTERFAAHDRRLVRLEKRRRM
jgi:hypothetical protein